jgi:hypothetical protein
VTVRRPAALFVRGTRGVTLVIPQDASEPAFYMRDGGAFGRRSEHGTIVWSWRVHNMTVTEVEPVGGAVLELDPIVDELAEEIERFRAVAKL